MMVVEVVCIAIVFGVGAVLAMDRACLCEAEDASGYLAALADVVEGGPRRGPFRRLGRVQGVWRGLLRGADRRQEEVEGRPPVTRARQWSGRKETGWLGERG